MRHQLPYQLQARDILQVRSLQMSLIGLYVVDGSSNAAVFVPKLWAELLANAEFTRNKQPKTTRESMRASKSISGILCIITAARKRPICKP
jgi:hypothetical protein